MKGMLNIVTVFAFIAGITIILTMTGLQSNPYKMLEEEHLKEYNQQMLLNILQLKNDNNETVFQLIEINECSYENDIKEIINNTIKQIIKPGFNYIFQTNKFKVYDNKEEVNLTAMSPARINTETYCDTNLEIIFGAYYEK